MCPIHSNELGLGLRLQKKSEPEPRLQTHEPRLGFRPGSPGSNIILDIFLSMCHIPVGLVMDVSEKPQ